MLMNDECSRPTTVPIGQFVEAHQTENIIRNPNASQLFFLAVG